MIKLLNLITPDQFVKCSDEHKCGHHSALRLIALDAELHVCVAA
jgi:hypothetical protein